MKRQPDFCNPQQLHQRIPELRYDRGANKEPGPEQEHGTVKVWTKEEIAGVSAVSNKIATPVFVRKAITDLGRNVELNYKYSKHFIKGIIFIELNGMVVFRGDIERTESETQELIAEALSPNKILL